MDAIECFGGDMDGGLEAEGDVGAEEIVVDGFGDTDAVESFVGDWFGDGHGAVATDDDECFDFSDLEMGDADIGEVFVDDIAIVVFSHRVVLWV